MTQPLNIIFAGTPDFAAKHLAALIHSEHKVIGVYSQPDRPAGRGKKLQASPVKQLALKHEIEVFQPQSLRNEEAQQQLSDLNADIMVVVAYGLILPQAVLDTPRLGCINVHGSLLPRWRGAAPIQRAIWAGDAETGVTIMQMDKGLDTGAMLLKQSVAILPTETSASLYNKLADIGPAALLETLSNIESIQPEKQDDKLANYAEKLTKSEARLNWTQPAEQLERNVRAFNPWPVAFFELDDGPVKVRQAEHVTQDKLTAEPGQIIQADKQGILVATATDALLITNLQMPGKKAMAVADVLNAKKDLFKPGTIL